MEREIQNNEEAHREGIDQCCVTIELPIPLPTWNRVLAMHHWERKKLRDSIHQFVFISTQYAQGLLTQTAYQQKQLLMESSKRDYLQMIRPSMSKKSAIRRKKVGRKKR